MNMCKCLIAGWSILKCEYGSLSNSCFIHEKKANALLFQCDLCILF